MKEKIITGRDNRRRAIVVANEKGGAGKSTLALAITDKLSIAGHIPIVVQIDRQKQLSAALGQDVITIASDPKAARTDPGKELARFSPVLDAVERADVAAPIIIDIGAGEVGRVSEWAALVDLDEELGEFGFHPVVFVPFTAEAKAMRQAHFWSSVLFSAAGLRPCPTIVEARENTFVRYLVSRARRQQSELYRAKVAWWLLNPEATSRAVGAVD